MAGKEKAGKIFTSQCLPCLLDYRTFFTGTSISIEQNTLGKCSVGNRNQEAEGEDECQESDFHVRWQ